MLLSVVKAIILPSLLGLQGLVRVVKCKAEHKHFPARNGADNGLKGEREKKSNPFIRACTLKVKGVLGKRAACHFPPPESLSFGWGSEQALEASLLSTHRSLM